jgi:hypothetical protein
MEAPLGSGRCGRRAQVVDLFDGVDGIAASVDPSTEGHDPHGVDLALDGEGRGGPAGPMACAVAMHLKGSYGTWKAHGSRISFFMAPARDPRQGRARADRRAQVGQGPLRAILDPGSLSGVWVGRRAMGLPYAGSPDMGPKARTPRAGKSGPKIWARPSGDNGPAPAGGGPAPVAFPVANLLFVAVLCGRAKCLTVPFGGFRHERASKGD